MFGISKEHSARGGKKKRKPKGLRKHPTGEAPVFKEIWDSTPHDCRRSFVTGLLLPDVFDMRTFYFSHILSKAKGKYPMFKLYPDNIVFMTFDEHQLWEYKKYTIKDSLNWEHVFKLETDLKLEYDEHKREHEQGRADYLKR